MRIGLISMGLADPMILVQFVFLEFLCYLPIGCVVRTVYDQILFSVFLNYHFFLLNAFSSDELQKEQGKSWLQSAKAARV